MLNLPPQILEQIRQAIKRPVGTFEFTVSLDRSFFNPQIRQSWILWEIVSGAHIFRLERTNNFGLQYYYSSPGAGTRVAVIQLSEISYSEKTFFAFTWSPKEINVYVGPKIERSKLVSARGIRSIKQLRVGEDGKIFEIGDQGMKIMGIRVRENGKLILQSTALEAWEETKETIKILHTGNSIEGYIFDILIANLTLPLMVTGFEVYTKRRFSELEKEGITPNFGKIKEKMRADKSYESDEGVVETINFQDFKNECKEVYFYGFGIKFRELGMRNEDLEKLENLFG